MTFTTTCGSSNASASASLSQTPTPNSSFSTADGETSIAPAASASIPDNYADVSPAETPASSPMRRKSTNSQTMDHSDPALEADGRRASGRVRKPTAKAVALNGSKSYSPLLSDTIVIGETSPKRRRSSNKDRSPSPTILKDEPQEMQMQPEIPETPAIVRVNAAATPSPEMATPDAPTTPAEPTPTPSRRQSTREKRLTTKALSDDSTGRKRPANNDFEEAPVRKSVRLSHSGAKIPSKLRYSVSSGSNESQDAVEPEAAEMTETPSPKKSMIIILKYRKAADASESPAKPKKPVGRPPRKGKSRRPSVRQKVNTKAPATKPSFTQPEAAAPRSCNLSCLLPSSRLLAMAEIALQMPDEEDEEAEATPGTAYDWRMYTHTWCQCDPDPPLRTNRTNSAELARALMPNTVATGSKQDPVDLSPSVTPDSELLAVPVNTILKVSDAERLSQIWTDPRAAANRAPNGLYNANGKRPADDLPAHGPDQPPRKRMSPSNSASPYSPLPQASYPSRRTFEDRLRDDYNALGNVRKRAAAKGIPWTYNQTFEDLQALIAEAENREQQTQYRQQSINPPTVLGRAQEASEARPPPTGFGVLLPPKGTTFVRGSATNGLQSRNDNPTSVASFSARGPRQKRMTSHKISFVDENKQGNTSKARRAASPARPKSSRFRVDPRGLQGQSPGPGTIINMAELKAQAEEARRKAKEDEAKRLHEVMTAEVAALQTLSVAWGKFEAFQKQQEEEENEERRRRLTETPAEANGIGNGRA